LRAIARAAAAAGIDREYMTASRALERRHTLGQYLLVDSITRMATAALNFDRHRFRTSALQNTISAGAGQPVADLPARGEDGYKRCESGW
jgi:hypothetical protein